METSTSEEDSNVDLFERRLSEARDFIAHPEKLEQRIQLEQQAHDSTTLRTPQADPFAYRMTHYRGFVRYPERLRNSIVAERQPLDCTRSFLPTIMDIEPNSRCNFRCTMCQVSAWERGKRAEDMPFDQFKDFIDSVPTLTEVKLHGMGEPLLHKDFIAMVRYLVDKDIWVRTTVNGSLLHARDNYKKLIDAGIGEVQTSFDGANKEVFEKIRRKSNFERVVNNLTLLNEYANTKDRPYTRMWVVVQRYNRHQIFDFVELALKMKFKRLSFSMSLNDWGQDQWYDNNESLQPDPLTDKEKSTLLQMSQSSGLDISLWEQADTYKTAPQAVLCPWIFGRSYIGSDLRIAPCSIIGNPDVADLGDARNFTHEWNGDSYRTFRQAHLEGRIPRCCQQCYAVTHTRRQ